MSFFKKEHCWGWLLNSIGLFYCNSFSEKRQKLYFRAKILESTHRIAICSAKPFVLFFLIWYQMAIKCSKLQSFEQFHQISNGKNWWALAIFPKSKEVPIYVVSEHLICQRHSPLVGLTKQMPFPYFSPYFLLLKSRPLPSWPRSPITTFAFLLADNFHSPLGIPSLT